MLFCIQITVFPRVGQAQTHTKALHIYKRLILWCGRWCYPMRTSCLDQGLQSEPENEPASMRCLETQKMGTNQPVVHPRSKLAPARPNPTAKAMSYIVNSRWSRSLFFLLFLGWLNCLSLQGTQGKTSENRPVVGWSLFLSWRQMFCNCSNWNHCL